MRGDGAGYGRFAPDFWYFVFSVETAMRWWRWWPGHFKHVTCLAPVPSIGCWLVIDPCHDRTEAAVIPDDVAWGMLAHLARPGTEIVRMPVLKTPSRLPRWGHWCTALAGHLVGLSPCALRPDGLLRQCLRNGGVVIDGTDQGTARSHEAAEDGRTAVAEQARQDHAAGP